MRDEGGRIISPDNFIVAAERYGITPNIDRWVIENAFRWLVSEADERERLAMCSINLSGQSLGDDKFLPFVIDQFQKSGLDASKICFEITETAAVASFSQANRFIQALKELGCKFALDDFGTGLSSFGYLKHFPVDFLKIDGSFVREILHDPIDREMVRSINEIGHLTGKQTIAEFAENAEIIQMLTSIGIDYAQGLRHLAAAAGAQGRQRLNVGRGQISGRHQAGRALECGRARPAGDPCRLLPKRLVVLRARFGARHCVLATQASRRPPTHSRARPAWSRARQLTPADAQPLAARSDGMPGRRGVAAGRVAPARAASGLEAGVDVAQDDHDRAAGRGHANVADDRGQRTADRRDAAECARQRRQGQRRDDDAHVVRRVDGKANDQAEHDQHRGQVWNGGEGPHDRQRHGHQPQDFL